MLFVSVMLHVSDTAWLSISACCIFSGDLDEPGALAGPYMAPTAFHQQTMVNHSCHTVSVWRVEKSVSSFAGRLFFSFLFSDLPPTCLCFFFETSLCSKLTYKVKNYQHVLGTECHFVFFFKCYESCSLYCCNGVWWSVCMCVCVCACMLVCVHACMRVCSCVCVCMLVSWYV